MTRFLNVNFGWPYFIGVVGLIAAGSFIVRVIIGAFYGTFGLKGGVISVLIALMLGGLGWLFIKVAQANQEANEEPEA